MPTSRPERYPWFIVVLGLFGLGLGPLMAAELPVGFVESIVVSDVEKALDVDWDPDGGMWIAGKHGEVWVVRESMTLALQIPVETASDGGLAAIAVDPDYAVNSYIWLYYLSPPPLQNRLSRFTNVNDQLMNETVMLSIDQASAAYNGGCLTFMPDGKIMLGTGWDGNALAAQDPFSRKGKLLRLNTDGTAPADNPYFDGTEGDSLVWAIGLRQPWRCNVQPGTARVFLGDVGWASWEEIDVAASPGSNFGWPEVEGPGQGSTPSVEPLYAWPQLPPPDNHASIGGQHVPPGNFPGEYVDDYFFADYNQRKIYRMQLDGFDTVESVEEFGTDMQLPVTVKFGPDGAMYYAAYQTDDIRKVEFIGAAGAGGRVQNLSIQVYEVHRGGITLHWAPSCNPGDTNYSIYAGTVGTWDVAHAVVCSTFGSLGRTVFPPPDSTFYLIVPHNDFWQGSFGVDSEGSERSLTGSFCLPPDVTPCM